MKLLKTFNKIVDIILIPIQKNSIFFCMMYLLGIVTTFTQVLALHAKIPRINFFTWIFDVYIICIFLLLFPRKTRKFIRICIAACLYLLSIVDAFLNKLFYAKIGPEIINLLLETNQQESREFLDQYLKFDIIFSGVGVILILILIHIISECYYKQLYHKINFWYRPTFKNICAFITIISFGISIHSRIKLIQIMTAQNTAETDLYINNYTLNTPANNLLFGFKMRQLANRDFSLIAEHQEKIHVDSCTYTSKHIIFIIGESYIKSHSQLYGYPLPTTPRQLKRTQKGAKGTLIPFSNVISPANLTSVVFKNIFSLHSIDDKNSWTSYALFPVLFKDAGYHVTFITNQFVKNIQQDVFNFSGGLFLNDNRLNKLQFDTRNTSTHQYDEGVLSDYDSLKRYNTGKDLTIFHLAGQHIYFDKRTPNERKVFKENDYRKRNDLNEKERQTVADYDNATLYNDYVVDAIIELFEKEDAIVIYMPDHGEECYDSIHRVGRMPQGNYSPKMIVNEFEIPFWIWCSDPYIEKHPQIFNQIKEAKDRPFMTDDIPHLLLYLAGIQYKDYKESKNILCPLFDTKRKRMIDGTVDFDEMLKKNNHLCTPNR